MQSSQTRHIDGTTACGWDSVIPFAPMWDAIKHVIKPRAAVVLFGSQPFTSALVMSNPSWFKYEWVWQKDNCGNPALSRVQPMKYHENLLVFCETSPMYYPQMKFTGRKSNKSGKNQTFGMAGKGFVKNGVTLKDNYTRTKYRYPSTVLKFNKPNNMKDGGLHPTQKPVALMEYLIRTYTNEGDTVLDFTIGSGSTGVAAVKNGRYFIGIDNGHCEKEGEFYGVPWVDIARTRIANAAGDYCPAPRDNSRQMALFWSTT